MTDWYNCMLGLSCKRQRSRCLKRVFIVCGNQFLHVATALSEQRLLAVMPALRFLGKRWQVSTDVLPLFAVFSAFSYAAWIIYTIVAYFITVDIHGCNDSGVGRNYLATVCLFLTEYVLSMVTAVCIAIIGFRGKQYARCLPYACFSRC